MNPLLRIAGMAVGRVLGLAGGTERPVLGRIPIGSSLGHNRSWEHGACAVHVAAAGLHHRVSVARVRLTVLFAAALP
jgi:hypothetical protein